VRNFDLTDSKVKRSSLGLAFLLFLFISAPLVAQSVPPELFSAMQWRLIGPFRGGRAVAVSGIPGDSATYFFGSVGGGVWKTPNAGVTWEPLFDGQPIASIGALAVAPSNSQVIYAGTGESDIRSALSSGDGIYKSSDGGKTWVNVGLRDTRQISRIVVDPKNADVVYVGALGHAYGRNPERGVYKSVDGGKTWTHSLDKGPEIGVSDLAIATGSPSTLFAGTWQAHRPPWSTYAPVEGPNGGIYRTTDAGANWTQLKGNGLPDGDWGRVGVTVSANGQRVYALIDAGKKSGLYRSDDGGNTWTLANGDSRLTSRAWYFNQPTIDPNNPDVVYVPNVALYRSEDAGKTISIVRGAPGGDDYHQLWIDPTNSARMVLGTDQGTSVSLDRGQTWSSWFNQPIGQFYHVTTDNHFPYAVFGAQQDSGSAGVLSRTDHGLITATDWFLIGGGESGWIVVDPEDEQILYATGAYGGVVRYDRRTSLSQEISPWPLQNFGTEINGRKYRDPWTPMLVMSPVEKGALFLGTQYVMKTTDAGLHWQTISPDLTDAAANVAADDAKTPATVQNAKVRGFGVVYSIAPSPKKAEVIWAGSDTGLIHLTTDGGKTWSDVTPKGVSDWSKIAMIEASHFDPAVAYAAVDRHRLDDQAPYLYRTRDYGKTWQPITAGIGGTSFLNAIREDTKRQGLLFVGTELGIYVSLDDGDDWQPLQLNLPVSSVRDMTIHGDDLVIATHGRAFWILDNITPLRQIVGQVETTKPRLYAPATAVRVDNDIFLGSPFPPEEPTAKNPPDGAVIDYVLPAKATEVKLEISDSTGKLVRRYSSSDKKPAKMPPMAIAERWFPKPVKLENVAGMHRFVWDLRWNSSGTGEEFEDEGFGAPRGPRVTPGQYRVKLTVDGATFEQTLQVQMDPRSKATTAELEQQLSLAREIFGEVRRGRQSLAELNAAKSSLAKLKEQLQGKPALLAQAENLESAIGAIEKGSKASSETMGLESAVSGLQSALRVVEGGDRTTPAQAIEVYRLSDDAAKGRTAEWKKLKQGQLVEFNHAVEKAGLHPIEVSAIEAAIELQISQ
jgi:photosystem II stability/assembly factor-like uncharacterized protein